MYYLATDKMLLFVRSQPADVIICIIYDLITTGNWCKLQIRDILLAARWWARKPLEAGQGHLFPIVYNPIWNITWHVSSEGVLFLCCPLGMGEIVKKSHMIKIMDQEESLRIIFNPYKILWILLGRHRIIASINILFFYIFLLLFWLVMTWQIRPWYDKQVDGQLLSGIIETL